MTTHDDVGVGGVFAAGRAECRVLSRQTDGEARSPTDRWAEPVARELIPPA